MDLNGRVAVITGAAGGMGTGIARALAKRGCHLALVDLHAEPLNTLAAELSGVTVSVHPTDVSDKAAMLALPEAVLATHGKVNLVVNNAGVTVMKDFEEHSLEDWEWLMGVNFWGVIYGCHAFLPHLKEQDAGHIVNISSLFGILGVPNQTSYCASKFAVRGFSESLMEELRGSSVGVTVVHPGGVATGIVSNSRAQHAHKKAKAERAFQKMLSPDIAGEKIVVAVEKDKERLLITKEAFLIDGVRRIAPMAGNHWVINLMNGR